MSTRHFDGSPLEILPLACNLNNRRVVVAGGGIAAKIKVETLLRTGARVIVISPVLSESLLQLQKQSAFRWWKRKVRAHDLRGAALVVAATGSRKIDAAIVRLARTQGRLIVQSSRTRRRLLSFTSAFSRGKLVLGISTSGAAPALAVYVKQLLEGLLPQEWESALLSLEKVRAKTVAMGLTHPQKKQFWKEFFASQGIPALLQGNRELFSGEVKRCFSLLPE